MRGIRLFLCMLALVAGGAACGPSEDPSALSPGDASEAAQAETPAENRGRESEPLGCIGSDQIVNRYSAEDLFGAGVQCAEAGMFDQAAVLFVVADAYGRFDAHRVFDKRAHGIIADFFLRPEILDGPLGEGIVSLVGNEAEMADVCETLHRIGPPDYYPKYMIDYVPPWEDVPEGAPEDGLVQEFDRAAAWRQVMSEHLPCYGGLME